MFESRREFLQKLLVAATALGIDPLSGVVTSGDQYRNDRLRLTLRRPSGWEFSSVADFAALRERQALLDFVGDEIHPLKDPNNLPVFLFEHPQGREGMFSPAIGLYDEALGGPVPVDPARAHREVMLGGFAASYRDLRVLREPRLVHLQGAEGTSSQWSYVHDLDDGTCYQLSVCSLVVFREPRVHTFHFADRSQSPRRSESTWADFVASVSYRKE